MKWRRKPAQKPQPRVRLAHIDDPGLCGAVMAYASMGEPSEVFRCERPLDHGGRHMSGEQTWSDPLLST